MQRDCTASAATRYNLMPIKGFVHEVLRRSRTSGSVIRQPFATGLTKVLELVKKEDVEPEKERWHRIARDPDSVVSPKFIGTNNKC